MTTFLFRLRLLWITLAIAFTAVTLYEALQIGVDAGFEKGLPREHPFMETYKEFSEEFGGGSTVLVAVTAREGDIFNAEYLQQLKQISDESFYVYGVNRSLVKSIFTPNVRFIEIVDGGFTGGNVVPPDFDYSEEAIQQVRLNVLKSGQVGLLVSNDLTSAMVSLPLQEDVDQLQVAADLEQKIRSQFEGDVVSIEIIGFAKAMGEIADGVRGVMIMLLFAVGLVALLVNLFVRSWRLTLLAIICSLVAVVWNIGTIAWLGYDFDILSILVPFLIFAIGVSHALQILNRVNIEIEDGASCLRAAQKAFAILLRPGVIALLSDTLGFATIYLIDIPGIQDLAVMASLGVLYLILCNLCLLPLLISFLHFKLDKVQRLKAFRNRQSVVWDRLSEFTTRRASTVSIGIALVFFAASFYISQGLQIGDLHEGVPELRQSSRYNKDTAKITEKYSVGVDMLTMFFETPENGCIDHEVVSYIDDFEWYVSNDPNVHSTISMPKAMREVTAAWAEGNPKWAELSRNQYVLVQAAGPIVSSTGLRNSDCSVMPLIVFLKDHKAESIKSVVDRAMQYAQQHPHPKVNVRFASGNAGMMGAVNETIENAQYEMLIWIYASVTALCLLLFRSVRATLCVMLPLMVVSVVAYALMTVLEIGLKTSSLPVAALGVGIGVDYGIYIFSQLHRRLKLGDTLQDGYRHTLEKSGSAVMVTGLTLAIAVGTWTLSDLQFQADMGLLFATMLILNMVGAMHVGPSLAYWLYPQCRREA